VCFRYDGGQIGFETEARMNGGLRPSGLAATCAYHGGSGCNICLKDAAAGKLPYFYVSSLSNSDHSSSCCTMNCQ
jgi:hypothetical protein